MWRLIGLWLRRCAVRRRVYSQDAAWRWLRRNPGGTSPRLAEAMRLTPNAAAHILQRLRDGGYARMDHLDHRKAPRFAIWYAVGDMPPSNRSGCSIASAENLRIGWERWRKNLLLAQAAKGQVWTPRERKAPAHADPHPLSQAWMVTFSRIDSAE